MQDDNINIKHNYLYTQPVDPIIEDRGNNTPVRQNADCYDATNQKTLSVDINNNNASIHNKSQNQDDKMIKDTRGPEHEKTARNSSKQEIETPNHLQHSYPQYPLPLILPQEPNCDKIPSSEFKPRRFILFENKYGETGGGVISAVLSCCSKIKAVRYAQVAKHVWKLYNGSKHRHLVDEMLVMSTVWLDFDNVLAIADLPP